MYFSKAVAKSVSFAGLIVKSQSSANFGAFFSFFECSLETAGAAGAVTGLLSVADLSSFFLSSFFLSSFFAAHCALLFSPSLISQSVEKST